MPAIWISLGGTSSHSVAWPLTCPSGATAAVFVGAFPAMHVLPPATGFFTARLRGSCILVNVPPQLRLWSAHQWSRSDGGRFAERLTRPNEGRRRRQGPLQRHQFSLRAAWGDDPCFTPEPSLCGGLRFGCADLAELSLDSLLVKLVEEVLLPPFFAP